MIKHILSYAPAKLIPGVINFILLMIFARVFTTKEYGRYAYVLAIITMIQSILYPWIRLSLLRFYQKYKKNGHDEKYVHYTLFLFIIVSVFLTFGWTIFILNINSAETIKVLLIVGLPFMLLSSLFEHFMALSRAKLDSKTFSINQISKSIMRLVLFLLLVYIFNFNEVAIFISLIITNLILIIIYFKSKLNFNYNLLKPNKEYRNEILRYGVPLTFTFLLVFIISSSDRILIKFFLNNDAVGLYSLPYEFSTYTITNIFMVLNLAYFPVIIKEYEHLSIKVVLKRVEEYFNVLLLITLPVTIFIILLAPFISRLFLGENYNSEEAILIIQIITFAGFLSGLKSFYFDLSFHLGNKTSIQIIPVAISGISNIVFNFILIPMSGVLGAVFSSLIAFVLGIVASITLGRKIIKLPIPMKNIINILLPNIILFLYLYYTPFNVVKWSNFIINILLGSAIYLILIFVLNTVGTRYYLKHIFKKNY